METKLDTVKTFMGWTEYRTNQGSFFLCRGLKVIASVDTINKKEWLHISASRKGRTPNYEDLLWVKRAFCADDLPAYQVFPREQEYRSLKGCTALHLWQPLEGDPFPDPLLERAFAVCPSELNQPDPGWDANGSPL